MPAPFFCPCDPCYQQQPPRTFETHARLGTHVHWFHSLSVSDAIDRLRSLIAAYVQRPSTTNDQTNVINHQATGAEIPGVREWWATAEGQAHLSEIEMNEIVQQAQAQNQAHTLGQAPLQAQTQAQIEHARPPTPHPYSQQQVFQPQQRLQAFNLKPFQLQPAPRAFQRQASGTTLINGNGSSTQAKPNKRKLTNVEDNQETTNTTLNNMGCEMTTNGGDVLNGEAHSDRGAEMMEDNEDEAGDGGVDGKDGSVNMAGNKRRRFS